VTARILHVSDLHFGAGRDAEIELGLAALVEQVEPDLIVASGDLSHRAKRHQQERAARFLRSLGPPLLAVPGNHDIPWTLRRLRGAFMEFERVWQTTEPLFQSESLQVVGLNSARPWRHQSGGIRRSQIDRARTLLAAAPDGALRVVVLHHHLIGAPWRSRKKPVSHRNAVLAGLVDAGAELILAGHIHQAAVSERHEFEVVAGGVRGVTVSVAPGLGQPRPSRRGEARGVHTYSASPEHIEVETSVWLGDRWARTALRRFPRGPAASSSSSSSSPGPAR
jgi:3',5'-cyclic AMP phosphodiesterase CpdA